MSKRVLLRLESGKEVEIPVLDGTSGPRALNIKELYKDTGFFTYDPGFVSTASCSSSITFIDGDTGTLKYRGHDVSTLAVGHDFESIIYLLLYGEFPSLQQREKLFVKDYKVSAQIVNVIKAFPETAHPMSILIACFASLAASHNENYGNDVKSGDLNLGISAIVQVPVIVAMIHRHISRQDFIEVNNIELSYSERFLRMMLDVDDDKISLFTEALNKIFILHADHEQNASTAAVRLSGSAGSNLFACLVSGVATLWGPAHGGANESVIKMLEEIRLDGSVNKFISRAKDEKDPFKLMGFGHRVYKNYDPRARILKDACYGILDKLSQSSELLKIAVELEKIALHDEYFIKRKLYPNVDFYSGIIMNAMGIPTKMFTPIFALARTTGWVTQWFEIMNDKECKISRPRQLYIGK
ncbi:MAG: citrate synthase [Wolbachia endosymbiont of Fragariocoptes setiger]|nr:citrate synthase [Wolbachia endosymbiont of Fragariocoptes setiger]